jgi:hypothetical protein
LGRLSEMMRAVITRRSGFRHGSCFCWWEGGVRRRPAVAVAVAVPSLVLLLTPPRGAMFAHGNENSRCIGDVVL